MTAVISSSPLWSGAASVLWRVALLLFVSPNANAEPRGHNWHLTTAASSLLSPEIRRLEARRYPVVREMAALPALTELEQSERLGWRNFDYAKTPWRGPVWIEIDLGREESFDAVALVPANTAVVGFEGSGFGFPVRFRVEVVGENEHGTVLGDFSQQDFPNPGGLPVWLPAPSARGRRVRLTILQPWVFSDGLRACALAELMVLRGNRNLATGLRGVTVRTSDSKESPPAWSRFNLIDGQSPLGAPLGGTLPPEQPLGHCWHSYAANEADTEKWVQVDLGEVRTIDEVRLVPAHISQHSRNQGYAFPVRFRIEADDDAELSNRQLIASHEKEAFVNPGFSPVTAPAGLRARHVRVTATSLPHRANDRYAFALAELQVYSGNDNVARGATVRYLDSMEENPNWRAEFLTDGARWKYRIGEWPEWLGGLSRRRELLAQLAVIDAGIDVARQSLRDRVLWSGLGVLLVSALVVVAVFYRMQLRRVREADELRRRIAADLHDDLGSNLATIGMLTEMCLRHSGPVTRSDLEELHGLARSTADALRDVTWVIRPGAHRTVDLVERLRATAHRLLPGMAWSFEATPLAGEFSIDAQHHVLLALKEALHNIVGHAAARHVQIRLSADDGVFTLEVRDDGRGFEVATANDGQGLASLRHRAVTLGGAARFESAPGRGTTVVFTGRLAPRISAQRHA